MLGLLHETFVVGGPLIHSFSTLCKNFHKIGWVLDMWWVLNAYSTVHVFKEFQL